MQPRRHENTKKTNLEKKEAETLGMPRKQKHDLREFWPWYERSTHIGEGGNATPPPFSLNDIQQQQPAGAPSKSLQVFVLLITVALGGFVVLGILH